MAEASIWQWTAIAVLVTVALNPFIARRKNRSAWLWLVLGVLFNPIACVILLFLPAAHDPAYTPPATPGSPQR